MWTEQEYADHADHAEYADYADLPGTCHQIP